jgi:hypothetical protein
MTSRRRAFLTVGVQATNQDVDPVWVRSVASWRQRGHLMGHMEAPVRRMTTVCATLLILLLVLHHPLMGQMPMGALSTLSSAEHGAGVPRPPMRRDDVAMSGHGAAMAVPLTPRDGVAMGVLPTPSVAQATCPSCALSCPLMYGLPPDRRVLPCVAPRAGGSCTAAPTATVASTVAVIGLAGAEWAHTPTRAPTAQKRCALLQVLLL